MAIDLAQLVVSLEANSAKFQKDMDRANAKLDRLDKSARRASDSIRASLAGIRVAALIGSFGALVRAAANNVSQQRAMAESLGLTVSRFSELNYAARQNELSQEDLGRALFRLNTMLGDAASGGEKALEVLAKFGITAEQIRSGAVGTDEALRKVSDKFNSLPNGVEKSTLAADLFGDKLGGKVIPLLNNGSKGLDKLARAGEAAGAVMNDKVAEAVARANDKLSAFAQTIQTQVLVGLASLFGLVESFEGDKEIDALADEIAGLNYELTRLQEKQGRAETGGILGALLHTGDAARIAEINNRLREANRELARLKQQQLDRLSAPPAKTPPGLEPVDKEAEAARKAHAALLEKTRREVMLLDDAEGEAAKMRALVNELYAKGKIPQDAYLAFLAEANQRLDDLGSNDAEEKISVFAEQAARNIQSFTASLVDAALAGEDMGDVIVAALRRIASELITAAILDQLGTSFPAIGKLLSGKKAAGGPVMADNAYLVGEQGPELFVPKVSGTIVPNHKVGSSVEISIDARGADPASAANMLRGLAEFKKQLYTEMGRGLN